MKMDRRDAILPVAAMIVILTLCAAAQAQEAGGWLISGKRSYTFSTQWTEKYRKNYYQFTTSDLDKKSCDNINGYYWCQAKARCVRADKEKCMLATSGAWYDGMAAKAKTEEQEPAQDEIKDTTMGGLTEQRFGSQPRLKSSTALISSGKLGNGDFGGTSQAQRGPDRADWPKIYTTGRRSWAGQSSYIISHE